MTSIGAYTMTLQLSSNNLPVSCEIVCVCVCVLVCFFHSSFSNLGYPCDLETGWRGVP